MVVISISNPNVLNASVSPWGMTEAAAESGGAMQLAGIAVVFWVAGVGVLRAAVITHNKTMTVGNRPTVAVPSWVYAAWIALIAVALDMAIVYGVIQAIDGHWRPTSLLLVFMLRLPLHTGLLAWSLSASLAAAAIVQVFEIAIFMVLLPVVSAVAAIVYSGG